MDELDDLLRATFADREREAADGAGPAEAAGLADATRLGYARRTARRRQVMAVGTAGVVAVGGSTALAFARHGSAPHPAVMVNRNTMTNPPSTALTTATGSTGPTGSASSAGSAGSADSTAPTKAPTSPNPAMPPQGVSTENPLPVAGSRPWSSHGLQIRVPAQWKANKEHCGTPTEDTVLIGGGATEACLINVQPRVTSVQFGPAKNPDLHDLAPGRPATIDGKAALVSTGTSADGRAYLVVAVPDLDVSVAIKGTDPHLIGQIAATAQIVDVDANGCATKVASVEPAGPPTRPGAQSTMVPGKPTKAVVCHYGDGAFTNQPAPANGPILLTNGSEIAPDQIGGLTGILNSLKPGLATWQGLADSCPSPARDGYVLRFSYDSGPPVEVYLHTWDCDHEGFSNGAVTGLIPKVFVDNVQKYLPDMGVAISGEATSG